MIRLRVLLLMAGWSLRPRLTVAGERPNTLAISYMVMSFFPVMVELAIKRLKLRILKNFMQSVAVSNLRLIFTRSLLCGGRWSDINKNFLPCYYWVLIWVLLP